MGQQACLPVVVLLLGQPSDEGPALAADSNWIWETLNSTNIFFRCCTTVGQLFAWLAKEHDTIVILDSGTIDNMDGLTLCSLLRPIFKAGLVLLVRGGSNERIQGLNAGADICLSDPLDGPELTAVLHALYRRTAFAHGTPAPALPHPDASFLSPLNNGDASFDPTKEGDWILADQGWALRTPNHQIVRLTTAEREFLTQLFASPDHLFLRSNQDQGGAADLISKRKLDVVVSRLRVKVGNAGHPLPLHTCRGMGYQFSGRVLIAELNSFPHRLGHSGSEVDRVTFS